MNAPFFYKIMGGLKSSCRSIKCHLLMSICLKLGTAGWNCVTKQDPFRLFVSFREGLFSFFISYFGENIFRKVHWVASLDKAFFKIAYFHFKY